ncbi:MAG TPA: DUF4097 family beta strand repeat-containing protein [Pyrinomonadaceae bacterium]|nr:DUF4097 family beta strand repeat-containing protein [Pyrinomonadaceae bacterium]
MSTGSLIARYGFFRARVFSTSTVIAFLCLAGALGATTSLAQQHVTKRYPARKNVRVELKNISGTITVESWARDEIKLSATLESPTANFTPRQSGDGLVVDVMGDNRGRGDVGDVNFKLQVPPDSSVDVETRRGDINISNLRGGLVRAHVSSEGDITLAGITASQVIAQNTIGDIFFDGEFSRGGTYQFQSGQGNITIRIPADSGFRLVAAVPTKKFALGQFWNNGFKTLGDGRKYMGDVGDGRSSVTVTNFRGSITFLRR